VSELKGLKGPVREEFAWIFSGRQEKKKKKSFQGRLHKVDQVASRKANQKDTGGKPAGDRLLALPPIPFERPGLMVGLPFEGKNSGEGSIATLAEKNRKKGEDLWWGSSKGPAHELGKYPAGGGEMKRPAKRKGSLSRDKQQKGNATQVTERRVGGGEGGGGGKKIGNNQFFVSWRR